MDERALIRLYSHLPNYPKITFKFLNKSYVIGIPLAFIVSKKAHDEYINQNQTVLEIPYEIKNDLFRDIVAIIENSSEMEILQLNLSLIKDDLKMLNYIQCNLILDILRNEYNKEIPDDDEKIILIARRIPIKAAIGMDISKDIGFVAANYIKNGFAACNELDLEFIEQIYSHPYLKIMTEDSLLDDIFKIIEKYGRKAYHFMDFIRIYMLKPEGLFKYADFTSKHKISQKMVENLLYAYSIDEKNCPFDYNRYKTSELILGKIAMLNSSKYQNGMLFDTPHGLFEYFRMKYDNPPVEVTSSSYTSAAPSVVIAPEALPGHWVSNKEENSWIEFEFKNGSFMLSKYMFVSHDGPSYCKSWKVEAYNPELGKYVIISQVKDEKGLCFKRSKKVFSVDDSNIIATKIRITLTGKSSNDDYRFCLRRVEFFGKYFE